MKCPNCGAENPDVAFYCGRCALELREPLKPFDRTGVVNATGSMRGAKEADPMMAVAINVRRIFILLATTLLLTFWTSVYTLFWGEFFYRGWLFVSAWGLGAAVIVAIGLWYAVTKKRVTSL